MQCLASKVSVAESCELWSKLLRYIKRTGLVVHIALLDSPLKEL